MDVSDRRLLVQMTQEAKIASDFSFIRAILRLQALAALWRGLSPA